MIVSKIQGGLGNQMFQYAIARSLSIKFQENFFLDLNFYKQNNFRKFLLGEFENIQLKEFTPEFHQNKFLRVLDSFDFINFQKNEFSYYLDGYWQTEKYFKPFDSQIREDFEIKNFSNEYRDYETTSLHVRRTDYLASNGYHPILPIEYYENAIESLGKYEFLLIFSDDIKWCKSNLKFENMIFIENNNEIKDLKLMSECKNNIIANSTFSWWSAWLNSNKEKKIIAPKKWFGEKSGLNSSEIIPLDWIKI